MIDELSGKQRNLFETRLLIKDAEMMFIKNNIYLVLLLKSSILSVFEIGND